MNPLPKEITDEIRYILEGCRDGRLNHNQKAYTCGTARCVAGWKLSFDFEKLYGRREVSNVELRILAANAEDSCNDYSDDNYEDDAEWSYVMDKWKLTSTEANILFKPNATFDEQFALLEMLERGEREQ